MSSMFRCIPHSHRILQVLMISHPIQRSLNVLQSANLYRASISTKIQCRSTDSFRLKGTDLLREQNSRVLIDSALWKTEPLPCSLLQLAPTVARQNQRHSSKCDETKHNFINVEEMATFAVVSPLIRKNNKPFERWFASS